MVSGRTLELLIGAWSLLSITRTLNGNPTEVVTFGSKPTGTILYHPTGFMSVLITAAERPANLTYPKNPIPKTEDHEWALLAEHDLAYSGPFHVDEKEEKVVHGPLMASTLPSMVGTKLSRNFTIAQDGEERHLTLVADIGEGLVDRLTWRKIWREVEFGDCVES